MASHNAIDVIIIGNGLAGFAAAASLKAHGQSVAVLSLHTGATSISSGAWNFSTGKDRRALNDTSIEDSAFNELYVDLEGIDLGLRLSGGAAFVAKQFSENFIQSQFDSPFILPSTAGTWRRVHMAQFSQVAADIGKNTHTHFSLLGSPHWRFDAKGVARRLEDSAKKLGKTITVTPLLVSAPSLGNDMPLGHLATRLQASAEFREDLLGLVRDGVASSKISALLIPPLFVESSHFKELQTALSITVAECLGSLEPLPGYRLHLEILAALKRLGISVTQATAIEPMITGKTIKKLKVRGSGETWQELSAGRYILATGRIFSGGIKLGYHNLNEPIFSLPLFAKGSAEPVSVRPRLDWSHKNFSEPQIWASLGLKLDRRWQPVDSAGKPVLTNLFACGSGIGGTDLAHAGIGLGFMAFTGKECGDVVAKV